MNNHDTVDKDEDVGVDEYEKSLISGKEEFRDENGAIDYPKSEGDGEKNDIEQANKADDEEIGSNGNSEETLDSHSDIKGVEDTSSDSEDEEEPPMLKYTRLSQLPGNFFDKEPVSTCYFHENVFLFATHSGIIHISQTDFTPIRTFKAHKASVLSLYSDGKFFASGSMDGTIVIGSIVDEKDIIAYDFKRPIHSVVLERNFGKTRGFISGGMSGKVIYSTKNWLGQRSDTVLEENDGPIVSIQVIDDIILWMNDKGITVFNFVTRQKVLVIDKPVDSPRGDLYWPRVSFPETDRVLIGWGNYIWSLRISLEKADSSSKILPSAATISFRSVYHEKNVSIEHVYKLDCLISGIAGFKDDLWIVLVYDPNPSGSGASSSNNPELRLINSVTGEFEFEEVLGLKGTKGLGLNDFSLGQHIGRTPKYFVISATDGVIAEELSLSDRLNWFLEAEKYYDAWEISAHIVDPIKRLNIGIQHVDQLIQLDHWQEAADFLSKLLYLEEAEVKVYDGKSTINSNNRHDDIREQLIAEVLKQWDTWCNIFIDTSHIAELTDIIPSSSKFSLNEKFYNKILEYWLATDRKRFYTLIGEWKTDLFDAKLIEALLEENLETDPSNREIRRCVTDLYVSSNEPQKAVPHLLYLKDPKTIEFLSTHHLLINFFKQLPEIMQLHFKEDEINKLPVEVIEERLSTPVQILVANRHELLPKDIIDIFHNNSLDVVNYLYIQELNRVDDFLLASFGNERARLYSQFNRSLLLPFLTKNSNYNIDEAINLCESNEFIEELVYLFGKIGENRKALSLIINELDDPEKAIKFAKHQNDKDAWEILLDYSMEKPAFIKALIECADEQSNSFYDPITILKRMPENITIEGFTNSIIKFSSNNELNLLVNQLILKIIYKQSDHLSNHFRLSKLKGFEVALNDFIENHRMEKFAEITIVPSDQDRVSYYQT